MDYEGYDNIPKAKLIQPMADEVESCANRVSKETKILSLSIIESENKRQTWYNPHPDSQRCEIKKSPQTRTSTHSCKAPELLISLSATSDDLIRIPLPYSQAVLPTTPSRLLLPPAKPLKQRFHVIVLGDSLRDRKSRVEFQLVKGEDRC